MRSSVHFGIGRLFYLPTFSTDRDRDWVITLHLVVAGVAAYIAYRYGLGPWAIAIGVASFAVLTAAIAQRHLAWFAAVVGTVASLALGAVLGGVIASGLVAKPTVTILAIAAVPGAALGVWLGVSAYRKVMYPPAR